MTQITAKVPSGATTGEITVTLSNGIFTTSTFTVLALQVTPSQAAVLPRQSQQFTAIIPSQLGNNSVTWSVNGVNGGNSSVGTISATGLYTAPNITTAQNFTIRTTSVVRPSAFAEATVNVRPDLFVARSAAVSINKGYFNNVFFRGLSVKKGDLFATIFSIDARAAAVSVGNSLLISNISQTNFSRSSSTNITITGNNLEPVTTLKFINAATGTLDNSISVTNVSVSPSGTSLTATITISSSTTLETKVVVATDNVSLSSAGSSNGNNTIQIIP
jgi:hypothetical protein